MHPAQSVKKRFSDDGEPAELHELIQRGTNGFQIVEIFGADEEPHFNRSTATAACGHLRNEIFVGLAIGANEVTRNRPIGER